jgi:hypothetical protein
VRFIELVVGPWNWLVANLALIWSGVHFVMLSGVQQDLRESPPIPADIDSVMQANCTGISAIRKFPGRRIAGPAFAVMVAGAMDPLNR